MAYIVRHGMEGVLAGRCDAARAEACGLKLRTGAIKPDLIITQAGVSHFFVVAPAGCADAATAAPALARAEAVVGTFKSCNVLLPAACCALREVMDTVVRLEQARFVFLASGDDLVACAIRMVCGPYAAVDAQDMAAQTQQVAQARAEQVASWEAMHASLTSIRLGPGAHDYIDPSMAHKLSIFESISGIAAATRGDLIDRACLTPDEADRLHSFWNT